MFIPSTNANTAGATRAIRETLGSECSEHSDETVEQWALYALSNGLAPAAVKSWSHLVPLPFARVAGEPSDAQYALFGRRVAALFGSSWEWDSDLLEAVAHTAKSPFGGGALDVQLGDQDAALMKFWRDVADLVGVEYEVNEDEDDDDDENQA